MVLFPLETLRINPSTYSGRTAKLPDGTTSTFPSYARALAAGAQDIQPNYPGGAVSATQDNDTSAQDFITGQVQAVKDASGVMNEGKWSGQTVQTPGTNRKKPQAITTIGQKIKTPSSPENMQIQGAASNANEQNKKIRQI